MKELWLLLLTLLVGICWSGCDSGIEDATAPPPTRPAERQTAEPEPERPRQRRHGYIGIVVRAPANAAERTAVQNLINTLQQYRAFHGKWPLSLEELQDWTDAPLPELPAGRSFHYDPETGEVKISQEQ